MSSPKLIKKYNIPGPRYTSYPTVPYWEASSFSKEAYLQGVKRAFLESNQEEGISLYIHLPFCEKLCTFCGCHKRITKQHSVEAPYIKSVLKEWRMYVDLLGDKPIIKELHLGGGTPTFFSPENLVTLISGIFEYAERHAEIELSFEAHPNNTTTGHLASFAALGFKRNSFGVQDYDAEVQKTINRVQSYDRVEEVTAQSREMGYTSISHDLVFGLPKSTTETVVDTIEKTNMIKPDRIAFYSYAHVPWIKGVGQRGYDESDLPSPAEKRRQYEIGKSLLEENGYIEIGMDHFALATDNLYEAMVDGKLHRNFMGYTAGKTKVMIGLGMSAIGDSWYGFGQNVKKVEEYEGLIAKGEFPVFRGHILTAEDLVIRQHILNIMCHLETSWQDADMQFPELNACLAKLEEMEHDGILTIEKDRLTVTEIGRPYVRNICMAFDLRLMRDKPSTRVFSMTI